MKPHRSIAWRIRFALTLLTSLALVLSGAVTFYTYQRMEAAMVSDLTTAESARVHARILASGNDRWVQPFERDFGPSLFAWGEAPGVEAPTMPDELRALPVGRHVVARPHGSWHVVVTSARDGRLYVMFDTTLLERRQAKFAAILVVIVLVFSLLAFLVSSKVARWLIAPLDAMTGRLIRWAPRGAVNDIEEADEAARLMEVFNRVQDQVDSAIADQKEFSANLHHEIRTPLTVIRSDAEVMARQSAALPDATLERLRRIVDAVGEIEQSLESTWSLAHARADDVAPVPLRACVGDVIENLRARMESAGLALCNEVDPAHVETLSRLALLTVVRNIIRNAAMHAAPATLVIASVPRGLCFTDTGPGIAPSQLPHVFDRYYSSRRRDLGHDACNELQRPGMGLAIAKRVCQMQSWSLAVDSPVADGKGTRFTLLFHRQA